MSSQFGLLHERRFLPFFLTQFLGAFNDNLFKNALVVLITFQAARYTALSPGVLVNLAAGIFILPFFLFSASAGQLADKYEKSRLIRLIKFAEILVMGLAALAFAVDSLGLLLTTLFLMGTQSSLFGPVKYAILPAHLREHELVGGNALVESGTFVAILLGTIAGGLMIATADGALSVSLAALAVATGGYLASRHIPAAPIADAALAIGWNPLTETWRNIRFARSNRTVFLSILGISWFWFYGALFLSQFPGYAREMLGGDEHTVTLLLAVFSVGIGVGSLLCERLSGRHVEIGLVPFGSIGLSLFALDLWWVSPAAAHAGMPLPIGIVLEQALTWRVMFDLVMIGAFGGLFIVPLYALVQSRSDAACRSRVIAGNNILNALFMVVSAGLGLGLTALGFSIPQIFLAVAVLNAAVAIYIYTLVPEFLMRFLSWILINTLYRIRTEGLDRIPEHGPALLVCNHVSYMDALIVGGSVRRPSRFVMYYKIFNIPVMRFIFRTAKAIPIAPAKEDPALLEKAFAEIDRALAEGEIVCIFPEGGLTSDGEIATFRPGVERILAQRAVPVIPLAIRGLWGSIFSRRDSAPGRMRLPRRFWSRIVLAVGEPVAPTEASAATLEQRVRELRGAWA